MTLTNYSPGIAGSPMTEPLTNPDTGHPIELEPGEALARIAWAGKRPVVVVRTDPDGRERYRLAVPSCQTWNLTDDLTLEPWPPA